MRIRVLMLVITVIVAGLGVLALIGGEPADVFRDALYTTVWYLLVLLAAPRARPAGVVGVALGLSFAVEFFQLTGFPKAHPWARILLGSTFNAPDLLWYTLGAAACLLIHHRTGLRGGAHPIRRAAHGPGGPTQHEAPAQGGPHRAGPGRPGPGGPLPAGRPDPVSTRARHPEHAAQQTRPHAEPGRVPQADLHA